MWKTLSLLLILLPFTLSTLQGKSAILNPHPEPARCLSCHDKVPEEGGGYSLLQATIDETCFICHPMDCCFVGDKHRQHPSNLDKKDISRASLPRTLPMFQGKITCNTCHFHRYQPDAPNYKMVRLVKITETGVDWSGLCKDCHKEGY